MKKYFFDWTFLVSFWRENVSLLTGQTCSDDVEYLGNIFRLGMSMRLQ